MELAPIVMPAPAGEEPELEHPLRHEKKSMKSHSGADSGVGSITALVARRGKEEGCLFGGH